MKRKIYSTGDPVLDKKISQLVDGAAVGNRDLLKEMIQTSFKVCGEDLHRGDLKLLNTALKELRYAFKVFYAYRNIRKVTIFGSARIPRTAPEYRQAREFSRLIVRAGWMVTTGAATGIMHAGNEGAGKEKSFGVNVRLPFEQRANPVIADDPKLVTFKYFFTRKLIFIRESDATVLCPGGYGTHDEGFEVLTLVQTGKTNPRPLVCLDPAQSQYWSSWRVWVKKNLLARGMIDPEDMALIHFTHDPAEAVKVITDFYRNYHSLRYIADMLVLRIKRPLSNQAIRRLNRKYKGILIRGKICQQDIPFEAERGNEPFYTEDLIRLSLYFNRRSFAKLKMLIDDVNES